ncbi:unnamed protein product [Adineta steineri]|uniref:PDZ domain-containing protein n=1 Tax=Adineta steineri TaxID=433720 RepID=A0A815F3I3_9BILA|nr:unnamed protein product [Adineta steineri]
MSFFIDNCCLKLNYLVCGSNESSSEKKKKKFKSRQQGIMNHVSSNSKVINRSEPTPISPYHQHYVNVASPYYTIQQQNSIRKSFKYENPNIQQTNKYSLESSLNSFADHRLSQRSSSILNNGIIIKNIILRRNRPNERLGLTLCYGITSKSTTNIYIQQVDKESIAGHQGELRSGDQIIKINNHRVTSRDEAINLVNGACRILLQIVRFEFSTPNFSTIPSEIPLTEDDSGVILACNTDFDTTHDWLHRKSSHECYNLLKSCISLSSTALNHCSNCRRNQSYARQFQYRRCLSLNDLRPCSFFDEKLSQSKQLAHSQSIFGTTTDNEQVILKPLPYNHQQNKLIECRDNSDSGLVCGRSRSNDSYRSRHHPHQNQWTLKHFRRRYREQRLKEQYQTTDDEPMSELKQGRYWTRQQRKEHLAKAKQYRERAKFFQQHSITPFSDSATEDFNLLNRIFLRENHQELNQKPYLAYKYDQQSSFERKKLKRMIQQHYFKRIKSQSTTTVSISSTIDQPSMVIL